MAELKKRGKLVLSRKPGESIVITQGTGIVTVTIEAIIGARVRVGVTAPSDSLVLRDELPDAVQLLMKRSEPQGV